MLGAVTDSVDEPPSKNVTPLIALKTRFIYISEVLLLSLITLKIILFIYTMAKSMKDNKAIHMLKAAEEGGYGVIGVVSVNLSPSYSYHSILR
jgi:hypothetical protein